MISGLKNKNVLITGGTGFVGSHVVEALLREKAHVITTYQTHDPLSYFSTQGFDKKVTMVQVDINDYEKVFDVITKFHIEYIFHLAAQPLVDVAYANPKQTLYSNILGTINILESARLYPRVKAVVVASSDKAYGKLDSGKYKETDALRGDHPYEVSKSAADLICNSYYKTYKVPVVVSRFGNIYGEGDLNFSRIIPGALQSLLNAETLAIRSNGKFIRDYLYVKDVVNGYLLLAQNIEKVKGQAFNFGSTENLSVLDVVSTIEKTLKRKIKHTILDNAHNEIPYQSLDYSKISRTLGWKPKFTMKKVLPQIYKWYKKHTQ